MNKYQLQADRALALFIALVLALAFAFYSYQSVAQEHEHGGTLPDWYDLDCCNLRDCRPVLDKEVDFLDDKFAQPIAIYTSGDIIRVFEKFRWRRSKDERYHTCFRGETVYCIYIPIGV